MMGKKAVIYSLTLQRIRQRQALRKDKHSPSQRVMTTTKSLKDQLLPGSEKITKARPTWITSPISYKINHTTYSQPKPSIIQNPPQTTSLSNSEIIRHSTKQQTNSSARKSSALTSSKKSKNPRSQPSTKTLIISNPNSSMNSSCNPTLTSLITNSKDTSMKTQGPSSTAKATN